MNTEEHLSYRGYATTFYFTFVQTKSTHDPSLCMSARLDIITIVLFLTSGPHLSTALLLTEEEKK